jgi:hypothetical protein
LRVAVLLVVVDIHCCFRVEIIAAIVDGFTIYGGRATGERHLAMDSLAVEGYLNN